jgi:hypothetical protein
MAFSCEVGLGCRFFVGYLEFLDLLLSFVTIVPIGGQRYLGLEGEESLGYLGNVTFVWWYCVLRGLCA